MLSTRTQSRPFKGELSPELQSLLKLGLVGIVISLLGVAAFAVTSFVAVPFFLSVLANAWFAGSMIYLAGMCYGIVNDLIGCQKNLPYFMLGHQPSQKSVIKSNDPAAVGIAWGILATAGLSIMAAVVFSVATLITGFIGLPFAAFVLPAIALAIPFVLLGAHLHANQCEKKRREEGTLELYRDAMEGGLNNYQNERLAKWLDTPEKVNTWFSNSDRNVVGFLAMPVLGLVGLIGIISLTAAHAALPAVLFSAAVSVFPPLALGVVMAVGIMAACAYLYARHDKQIDNAYRMDFSDRPSPSPEERAGSHGLFNRHMPRANSSRSQGLSRVASAGELADSMPHAIEIPTVRARDEREEPGQRTVGFRSP